MIFVGTIASIIAVPTSAGSPTFASKTTALCSGDSVKVAFDGKAVVVTSGRRTLARATRTRRWIDSSCRRINYRGMSRWSLTNDAGRAATLTCDGSFNYVVIETERVGRGSRLAIWRGVLWSGGEMAEAVLGTANPWLAYRPGACQRSG